VTTGVNSIFDTDSDIDKNACRWHYWPQLINVKIGTQVLLRSVQQRGAWAGKHHTQSSPRCTKSTIKGCYTNFILSLFGINLQDKYFVLET